MTGQPGASERVQALLQSAGLAEPLIGSLERPGVVFALTGGTLLYQDNAGTRRVTLRDLTRIHSDQDGTLRVETPAGTALTASLLGFDPVDVQTFFGQVRDTTARIKQIPLTPAPAPVATPAPAPAPVPAAVPAPASVPPRPTAPAPLSTPLSAIPGPTMRPATPPPVAAAPAAARPPEMRPPEVKAVEVETEGESVTVLRPAASAAPAPAPRPAAAPAPKPSGERIPYADAQPTPAPRPAPIQPAPIQPAPVQPSPQPAPQPVQPVAPQPVTNAMPTPVVAAPVIASKTSSEAASELVAPATPNAAPVIPAGLASYASNARPWTGRLRFLAILLFVAALGLAYFQFTGGAPLSAIWTLIAGGVGAIALLAVADITRLLVSLSGEVLSQSGVLDADD